MTVLAGMHMHHAAGAWPIVLVGVLVLAGVIAAILLLSRRTPSAAEGPRSGLASVPPSFDGGPLTDQDSYEQEDSEEARALDASILSMLRQKGEPMTQSEIATNLGMNDDSLGPWLAGMERREMLCRTWDMAKSTYVVRTPAATCPTSPLDEEPHGAREEPDK